MSDQSTLFERRLGLMDGADPAAPLLINLGAGPAGAARMPSYFEGWRELRVDVDPEARPDIVADLTDLSQIAPDSGDVVWASHCIEHLFQHEVGPALREIRRILSPNGFACVRVPDLQTVAAYIAQDRLHEVIYTSNAGPITAHDVIFGFGADVAQGRHTMAHRTGFTPTVLVNALREGGFETFLIRRTDALELVALITKTAFASDAEPARLLDALGL